MNAAAAVVLLAGLQQPVEILRDQWGVPHIYASNAHDLFFAQGYIVAKDRLFQIDLWRRINVGNLAEVQGPAAIPRDRIARLVRYRGDWDKEWTAYAPDAKAIATAFTDGINAYIDGLGVAMPLEFRLAGYKPARWRAEDCAARIAGLLMIRNIPREVERAIQIQQYGLDTVQRIRPPEPFVKIEIPKGLDLKWIQSEVIREFSIATGGARVDIEQGSNNWVVDGTRSVTGKPLLANDPHRPINIPSLRKTVHLVAPGWNVIGAGEPALPGIALGHNEEIGWGFTIVGIDQGDLYVEKLNPANRDQYWHKGAWRNMEKERQQVPVKGRAAETVDLKYTVHGPVIHEDAANNRAFALKWVGADPGGAGYLRALAVSRAKNWSEFKSAVAGYKVPSENLVYADRAGNIGWIASGAAPIRPNWKGLLPVPGDGDYEWQGFLSLDQHPQEYNPPRHWIATANHNILPKGYPHTLGFEWNPGYRHQRIVEMMSAQSKFGVKDFERMQYDVTSVAAKQFQNVLRKRLPNAHGEMKQVYERMLRWDGRMTTDSVEASLFEVWTAFLGEAVTGSQLGAGANLTTVFDLLERESGGRALQISYDAAVAQLQRLLGTNRSQWTWGRLHTVSFQHSLRVPATLSAKFNRGPIPRPGDGNTVNAAGGGFRQSSGASYRQILDVADWDRSVITNVPGESGDPDSKHYDDLLPLWSTGRYHALPYSRKAVEAATEERIELKPKR